MQLVPNAMWTAMHGSGVASSALEELQEAPPTGSSQGGSDWQAAEEEGDGSRSSNSDAEGGYGAPSAAAAAPPASSALQSSLLEVPAYYRNRHFLRIGSHAYNAWDDCMWLLMLQEPAPLPAAGEDTASSAVQRVVQFFQQMDGDHSTAFRLFERELLLMKPFLMFCGVYAGMMALNNKSYVEMESNELIKDIGLSAGFEFVRGSAAAADPSPKKRARGGS